MLNLIKKHPKRTIIISCAILFIVTVIIVSKIFNLNTFYVVHSEQTQQIFFLYISLENWCTMASTAAIFCGAMWGLMQYDKTVKIRQQEKASVIAKDFADNLVEDLSIISEVLMKNQEVQKIIETLNGKSISEFTRHEVSNIYSNEIAKQFMQIIISKNTQKRYRKILKKYYTKKEQERFDSHFTMLVDNTLNQLEAICINISSRAAGSQFIYESLHQMFLSTVELLYIRISISNHNNVDKYYTNIITVYNMWNKQKEKDIKKLEKTNKKIKKLNERAEIEITRLLNKQSKTV